MTTRLGAAARAMLAAAALALAVPLAASGASATTTHPWVTVTLTSTRVEHGAKVGAKACWHNATPGWIVEIAEGRRTLSFPERIYSAPVAVDKGCATVVVTAAPRGIHPFTARLLTSRRSLVAVAVTFLYVYAPVAGSTFQRSVFAPNCGGKGTVVVGAASVSWTCSMTAVSWTTTVRPTTCRRATFKLASTDNPGGDPSSSGKTIFELAQNPPTIPLFARFHDNVVTTVGIAFSGGGFAVSYKSNNLTSRMYFLDDGSTADCYTATGI